MTGGFAGTVILRENNMAEVENPTKMTDEVVKKLEEVFALDGSVDEACYYANISRQCYYNWIKSFPKMQENFDRLRQRPVLKARQTVVKSLDQPNYAFEYLKRKRKKEFGDNVDITTAGEKISFTNEQEAEIAERILKEKHETNRQQADSKTN
jgi:predicted DNA-binding protein YlxM (UPF0122 family)